MSERRQINLAIEERIYAQLQVLANEAGMPASTYARVLFEAAYSARHATTGDAALDAAVARVLLLTKAGVPPKTISDVLCISPEAVSRAIAAWRSELAGVSAQEALS